MTDILDLFPEKVFTEPNSGCWLWTGSSVRGYGQTFYKGVKVLAHRRSFELSFGSIPEGTYVLHKCDNKYCVNPSHLEAGDQKKNMQDAVARGRQPIKRRSRHAMALLTEDQVAEIQGFARNPQKRGFWSSLAKRYGVDKSTISAIKCGKSWAC